MKKEIFSIYMLLLLLLSCQLNTDTQEKKAELSKVKIEEKIEVQDKPKVSFTFDDGITRNLAGYKFEDWNNRILSTLKNEELRAVFFVTGANKLNKKGKYLLESWSKEGHLISNHTYTHPNYNSEKLSIDDFEEELLKTDKVISKYDTYKKLFRFPYLKEGNTEEKISGFRNILSKHGYKNGHVTIDASDWYIDGELIKCIKRDGKDNVKVEKYKAYYLQHILERANFYEDLSYQLTNRHINHTLLLHHNLTSALFLSDLIQKFKSEGWEVVNADEAFQDAFFNKIPKTNPAGESLVWSLAKETGEYENILRYPAEDSRYEIPKMKDFGLQIKR